MYKLNINYYLILLHSYMSNKILPFLKKCNKDYIMGKKKIFSTRVDEDRIKELKHLAVDADKSLGALLEEAMQDLLKKYEKKPPK